MPLVQYDQRGAYSVFPFYPKEVLGTCHLVINSKPGILPLANLEGQNPNRNSVKARRRPATRSATTWGIA